MGNPLMGIMGQGGGMRPNNPMQMVQQFQKFYREMKGVNAADKMKELVQSGKITQKQADQAMEMARQMRGMFKQV